MDSNSQDEVIIPRPSLYRDERRFWVYRFGNLRSSDATERLLSAHLGVGSGSGVSLEQAKFAAEKRSLNFSSPEADLGQFVLPANRTPVFLLHSCPWLVRTG